MTLASEQDRRIAKDLQRFSQARATQKPRPPEELVGALQDSIHRESGIFRPAKSVKVPHVPVAPRARVTTEPKSWWLRLAEWIDKRLGEGSRPL